jgi:soluble lytic murein transglycosylase-like protein
MFFRSILSAVIGLALAVPVLAEDAERAPQPFPTFEAKRIKPPKRGARVNIVQIPIGEPVKKAKPASKAADKPREPSPGKYAWFWDDVSPKIEQAGAGRLQDALRALEAKGNVAAPRFQTLQSIAEAQGSSILRSTVGTKVSPALVLAVISVESAGRVDAVSPAGAEGLMQLIPATAERFGVADSLNAEQNIAGGVKYLDWLMREFGSDPILVLAGYNAGEGAVRSHSGVPPYAETRDYVPKVLSAYRVARALCKTPPEFITDGCVFSTF